MIVYTDGSFSKKPNMSGFGIVIITKDGQEYHVGGYSYKCKDNNVAEVLAISAAFKFIDKNNLLKQDDSKVVVVMTDSQYALSHMDSPREDEFEKYCYDYINNFKIRHKTQFFHIKGHVHDGTKLHYYNNLADELASEYRKIGLEKWRQRNLAFLKKKNKEK